MAPGRKRSREFWIGDIKPHGRKFRFFIGGSSDGGFKTFATLEEAEDARAAYERAARKLKGDKTVEEALNEYERWKRDPNGAGNKSRTVDTIMGRLRGFFPPKARSTLLYKLTETKCQEFYDELTKHVAVDTHRGTLSVVKTFLKWCVKKKWISKNPATEIVGTGKRKAGEESKPQLRIDEVRRYTDVALWLCTYGPDSLNFDGGRPPRYGLGGPMAALAVFYLALRADEVASRLVRDLDDTGRVLWVPDAKTEAGRRRQQVPEFLQPIFRDLTMQPPRKPKKGESVVERRRKAPTDRLFGGKRWWVRTWVQRICDLAGAPIVCAHAMRGLHITLALREGETAESVTRAVGHEYASFKRVTLTHYAQRGTQETANQNRIVGLVRRAEKRNTSDEQRTAAPTKSTTTTQSIDAQHAGQSARAENDAPNAATDDAAESKSPDSVS